MQEKVWRQFPVVCTLIGRVTAYDFLSARLTISFALHQFPPTIIRHTVWLYLSPHHAQLRR